MSERHEWESVPVEEAIDRITTAGLLTERQAEAYVLRDIEAVPRPAAAAEMDISANTLDNKLAAARQKVEESEATIEVIDDIRHRPLPDECAVCGAALHGLWGTTETGEPLCPDCADIDPANLSE